MYLRSRPQYHFFSHKSNDKIFYSCKHSFYLKKKSGQEDSNYVPVQQLRNIRQNGFDLRICI
jgi:hypothetical protein